MPELPEVETIKRALEPAITQSLITEVRVRERQLRWPISRQFESQLRNQIIESVARRGKYLLFTLEKGTLLLHLGMSGRLFLLPFKTPVRPHDHIDFVINKDLCLRFNDPRRFGAAMWVAGDPCKHHLLHNLGVEPLTPAFSAAYLYEYTQKRRVSIKALLMDHHVVVGVGNIYANEALFHARIHPSRSSSTMSLEECERLVPAVKQVLEAAIEAGGTTLRDFFSADGNPGYFQQQLYVYGRDQAHCLKCGTAIESIRLSQRSTFFCPFCQPHQP